MIRIIDVIVSLLGLIVLSPVFLIIAIWIKLDDHKGPVFFKQTRVGKDGVDFGLYKFRSMYVGSDRKGLITIGGRDPRITRSGYYIRKFKLDELPQLINVLKGDMSLVGPRPEVRKYVDMYTEEQRHVLDVRPGITDYASIEYIDENVLLALSDDPDKTYIEEIMPAKIRLNMKFIKHPTLLEYFNILLMTFAGISIDKFRDWYFTKAALPYWSVLALDIIVGVASSLLGYAIENDPYDLIEHFWRISFAIGVYIPVILVMGKLFHSYDIQYRHTTVSDLYRVGGTMFSGAIIIYIIRQIWPIDNYLWRISGKTLILAALLTTLGIMLIRILTKTMYDRKRRGVNLPLAVIYSTRQNVEYLAQAFQDQMEFPCRICGFLTEEDGHEHHYIMGKRIFQKDEYAIERLKDKGVEAVICGPTVTKNLQKDRTFADQLMSAGIKVIITPEIVLLNHTVHGSDVSLPMQEMNTGNDSKLAEQLMNLPEQDLKQLITSVVKRRQIDADFLKTESANKF